MMVSVTFDTVDCDIQSTVKWLTNLWLNVNLVE